MQDLPPALEDCTELLKSNKQRREQLSSTFGQVSSDSVGPISKKSASSNNTTAAKKPVTTDSSLLSLESSQKSSILSITTDDSNTLESSSKHQQQNTPLPKEKPKKTAERKGSSFGSGLKGGFFNNKTTKATTTVTKQQGLSKQTVNNSTNAKEIPFVKPTTKQKSTLVIDEVQSAIKGQMNALQQQEWLTPEFLDEIDKDPVLAKAFSDPTFSKAVDQVSKAPERAIKMLQDTRPDLVEALKKFIGLLGKTMNKISIDRGEGIPDDLPQHEKDLLKKVYSDPKVEESLKDPLIQQILNYSRLGDHNSLNKLIYQSPQLRPKIQTLVQCGLMRFQ